MLVPIIVLTFILMPALTLAPSKTLYALLPLLPAALFSPFNSRLRYYLRLAVYVSGLGLTSIWGVFVGTALFLARRKEDVNYVVARSFYHFVGPLVGIRFRIEGREHLENNRPYVIVGNHQTMLDILYLGAMFPRSCSIMAKKELKYAPLLGQYIAMGNNFFVDRASRTDAVRIFSDVADSMKKSSTSLFVFAEGTRHASPSPHLQNFKKGAFYLAVQGQVPIIPVVCENYWNAYSSRNKQFNGGEVIIKVLEPIHTKGLEPVSETIAELSSKAHEQMLTALKDLSERPDSLSHKSITNSEASSSGNGSGAVTASSD